MTKDEFIQKLEVLKQQEKKAEAQLTATRGAIQYSELMIAEWDKPEEPKPE